MTTSPDLGIPYIASSQAQPEVTHNDALNMLIALQKGAIDKDLNAPPGSPTNGDVYIVGPAPTGAWAGKANKIAIYATNAWTFVPGNDSNGSNIAMGARHEGLKIWVQDENVLYGWSGSAWAIILPTLPLSIANGGTGQTTAVTAIDALSVKGADIASAGTTNLATATGDFVDVTGTTTITALGTASAGVERVARFTGALTLTHNATSLILPGAANIATAAGDVARFRSLGSGNWLCTNYQKASGKSVIASTATEVSNTPAGNIAATTVQTASNELDSEKVAKAGDTMTGALTISAGGSSIVNSLVIASPNVDESVFITMDTEGNASPTIQQTSYRSAIAGPNFAISRHARGTKALPTILSSGDRLIDIRADGYDGAAFQQLMFLQGMVTQSVPAAGAMGTSLIVRLCPDGSGSITSTTGEALRLSHAAGLSLFGSANTIIDANRIHRLRQYTVATLPTVGTAGRLAAVTDANAPTYNATVAGGGAVNIPVYDNGTNWTCH